MSAVHRCVPNTPPSHIHYYNRSNNVPSETSKFIEETKERFEKGFYIIDIVDPSKKCDDYQAIYFAESEIFSGPHAASDMFDYFLNRMKKTGNGENASRQIGKLGLGGKAFDSIYRILFYEYSTSLPYNCRRCGIQALDEHYRCPKCDSCGICNSTLKDCKCPSCSNCGMLNIDWCRYYNGKPDCCNKE